MEHTGTKYESKTFREHVRLRSSVYVGSKKATENNLWIYNKELKKLEKKTMKYPFALYNICDEIILNALDHCLRTFKLKGKGKCDTIKLSLDKSNGEIICYNNGEGIVAEKNENGQYIVEMIFTKEMSGSNFSNDDEEKIGANGIGSKATNIMSSSFEVQTYDAKNKVLYCQSFQDGNLIINPPVLTKTKKVEQPFTQITFTPDFEFFEYKIGSEEFEELMDTLSILLNTRMVYVSAYLGPKYNIYFNENIVDVNSLETLAEIAVDNGSVVKCNMSCESNTFEILIAICDCDNSSGVEHISFINGLYLSDGGTHIKYVIKCILEALKPKIEKKLKDKVKISSKLISNFMFIFFKGVMNQLEYKNQSKNELSISETRFKNYTFDNKQSLKKLWDLLEEKIDTIYLNKITKETTTKKTNNLSGIKKYSSADYAGTSKSKQCTLFIPEGDSAESCIRNGLSGNKELGFKCYGLFNIQGVPLNVRKEIDIKNIKEKNNGIESIKKVIDKKSKLMENERINSLIKVLNLNWHFTYENEEEMNTLRYGKVVIATDFDLDGIGNICGLILNFFDVFFPNLIKIKYISILNTPLIRAYPTAKKNNGKKLYVEEFYTPSEFNKWSEENDTSKYKVNYIKGLATHSNAEIKNMFKDMYKNVSQFKYDDNTSELFEIYFGNDSDKRKKILSSLMEHEELDLSSKEISCSDHLNIHTREYQLDNIQRKMPHVIDGLNPARRKILCGSIMKFKQSNTKLKVFQLGGYIAEKMLYHHGSDSLNNTIINMAQNFIGSRNIPFLLPLGQFGSHYKGGKDAGSPRYIDTKLNKEVVDLLFPSKDMDLLEWNEIDGEMAEPKYFIPILPTVLMEDVVLPSTGWKIEIWARDFKEICANVINLIEDENYKIKQMNYFKNKFKGREIKTDKSILIGTYERKKADTIRITSLPPRVWIEPYIEFLKDNKSFKVSKVRNYSSIDEVNIEIDFPTGELQTLKEKYEKGVVKEGLDFIESSLNLSTKLSHCINLYSESNTVLEYNNYENVLMRWFGVRKLCYIKRINREKIMLKYKIIMCENYIRFIDTHDTFNLSKKGEKEADVILCNNNFAKLNKSIIDCAGRIPNEELENNIISEDNGANYNYLLNLSYRQMNKDCKLKLEKKRELLQSELKNLNKKDSYKLIWNSEINELITILESGFKNGFYKEDDTLFKN
jgi:DNA topoisomerase II